MKGINGYNAAQEITGEYRRLPAGGYVCRIVKVEDVPDQEQLKVCYDILEGEYKKYWQDDYERGGKEWWRGTFNQSYAADKLGRFKGFMKAIDESNGTDFSSQIEKGFDEQKLVRQKIGLVIGYRQYVRNGKTRTAAYAKQKLPVSRIEDGDFEVPELWIQDAAPAGGFATLDGVDEDLPF